MTVEELYTSIGGNYESAKRTLMMDKMIARFVVKLLDDTSCQKLLDAYEAGDANGVFEGAHAMKGVCANLGLMGLSGLASDIAEEFRPGNSRRLTDEELALRVSDLRELYEKSLEGIRRFAAEQQA